MDGGFNQQYIDKNLFTVMLIDNFNNYLTKGESNSWKFKITSDSIKDVSNLKAGDLALFVTTDSHVSFINNVINFQVYDIQLKNYQTIPASSSVLYEEKKYKNIEAWNNWDGNPTEHPDIWKVVK